ncbi:hypothetical protein OIU84_000538 [Salix udensis]|uniref:Pentatricopeptide repeat-containing protein n=1 Tax=Salix udensis TaxID=889485 RepID=A0AAD6L581_9ROSI|nr:hypothetical protein OIU84_000538 [Salix udensis]
MGGLKNVAKRSKKYLEEALYMRLFREGSSEASVKKELNQFLKSSKLVFKWEVGDTIKKLRSRNLYYPALKLSETMSKRGMNKTVSEQAIHLDLVAKSRGITAAENYFIDLPGASKNLLTYGALLNCYCKELMTEEAEALIEKMKELNLGISSMSYNSLMTLYTKVGQPERIPEIIQEMKANNVMPDSYTYNVWMRALAAVNDISGVERAETALKELEKRNANKGLSAFQFLITLYGRTGNLLEVYRIWRSLRLAFPKTANISYLNMIQVLVNLKDVPGAEKCFREWESGCSTYDIRVANSLISAYAKEGMLGKAEELKERAHRRGAKPNAKTWEIFLDYYLKNEDIKAAVDCLGNAVSTGRGNGQKWVPSPVIVGSLMAHFEQQKDVDGAEAAGRNSQMMRRRLKMENVEVSNDCEKLLESICVE